MPEGDVVLTLPYASSRVTASAAKPPHLRCRLFIAAIVAAIVYAGLKHGVDGVGGWGDTNIDNGGACSLLSPHPC